MQPSYILNSKTYLVEPVQCREMITIEIDGIKKQVYFNRVSKSHCELIIDGITHTAYTAQDENKLFIHLDGKTWELDAVDDFGDCDNAQTSTGKVIAPMPGVVIDVNVSVGDEVEIEQCLLMIESMKLQAEIKAPVAGVITEVNYSVGDSFDKTNVLINIDSQTEEDKAS